MKRKVLALMLISALLLSLFAGCGAAESVQSQQEAASVSAAAPETDAEVETPAEASEEAPESAASEAEEITNRPSSGLR